MAKVGGARTSGLSASLICSLLVATAGCDRPPLTENQRVELLEARIQAVGQEFPDVGIVTPQALLELMDRPEELVLIDVRSEEERAVSIIPGAITPEEFEAVADGFSDRSAVAYCTVGVRSSRYAQEMARQGIRVLNLRGSLLAWTYHEGPLEKDGEPTDSVHVYGPSWDLASRTYHSTW